MTIANKHSLTFDELQQGISVAAGASHTFKLLRLVLHIRLEIDPREAVAHDDRFILNGTGGARPYHQVKTILDDQIAGDGYIDLAFTDLVPNASYTLQVDPGREGSPYNVFENLPCAEMYLNGAH